MESNNMKSEERRARGEKEEEGVRTTKVYKSQR